MVVEKEEKESLCGLWWVAVVGWQWCVGDGQWCLNFLVEGDICLHSGGVCSVVLDL